MLPRQKVEAGSTEITDDCLRTTVYRPECAISRARILANDYHGKTFIGALDKFTVLKVSFRYGDDSWTQVFEGNVEEVGPFLTDNGWQLSALAYGYGRALRNTHCQESYGTESENPTYDTPKEIWDDLVDSHVNKVFGSATATGYALTKAHIDACATPSIAHVASPYRSNLDILNHVCRLRQADQAGSAGVHWMVDTSKNLRIKTIGADQAGGGWTGWYNTDAAGSTFTEGVDFTAYAFWKRTRDFANRVVLSTLLRKPGYDIWSESESGSWTGVNCTFGDVAVDSDTGALATIVGTNFLEMTPTGIPCTAYYPNLSANWDFTSVGEPRDPPRLNFYAAVNDVAMTLNVRLFTTDVNHYYQCAIAGDFPAVKVWRHFSLPIGPYSAEPVDSAVYTWSATAAPNAPDWGNIDAVGFQWTPVVGLPVEYVWIDDLHFSGPLIREAYNSTTSHDDHQAVLRLDASVDDTMLASDDAGTAGMLAYAELLTRDVVPVVGTVTVKGTVDLLPGQKVHIHADSTGSAYRVDDDFRITQVVHQFDMAGFTTTLEVTDDLLHTFARGASDVFSELKKAVFVDPEAKNLVHVGINPRVPRLTKAYNIVDA